MGAILYVLMNKLSQHLSVRSERLVADVCFLSVGLVIFFPRCCSRVYVVPLIIIYENKFLVTLSHLVFLQNPYKKKLLFSIQKTRKTLLTQCIYIFIYFLMVGIRNGSSSNGQPNGQSQEPLITDTLNNVAQILQTLVTNPPAQQTKNLKPHLLPFRIQEAETPYLPRNT